MKKKTKSAFERKYFRKKNTKFAFERKLFSFERKYFAFERKYLRLASKHLCLLPLMLHVIMATQREDIINVYFGMGLK